MAKFSDAMRTVTQGVYVLGVDDGEKKNLMTAAWLTQISSKPSLLVAVGSTHYTAEMIRRCGHFAVSVMAAGQTQTADHCGKRSGRRTDKLEAVDVSLSSKGDPLVNGAAAHLECEVTQIIDTHDHVLFCADVVAAEKYSDDVLIYDEQVFFG